jgi:hypothetical protein
MSQLIIDIDDKTGHAKVKYSGEALLIARTILKLADFDDELAVALNVVYLTTSERKKSENAFLELKKMIQDESN